MFSTTRQHNLFWGSSYDRGLDILLPMWNKIKEKYPDATLHICYGWDLFDKGYANNPERMNWKERMNKQMQQAGIVHHGRIGKDEVKKLREKCGIWVYPTYFPEINCITALESQREGCVPSVVGIAALLETVKSGVIVQGDIYEDEVQEEWLEKLLELMGNEKKWKEEQEKGKEFTKNLAWENIAKEWANYFE